MTEILIIGSTHLIGVEADLFTDAMQRQFETLNDRLASWAPDAIAAEIMIEEQPYTDVAYGIFSLDDLKDYEKMRKGSFGTRNRWVNSPYETTYKDETVQVCFRLGKTLGHKQIHCIDSGLSSKRTATNIPPYIQKDLDVIQKKFAECPPFTAETFWDFLRFKNSKEHLYDCLKFRLVYNEIGAGEGYEGARYHAAYCMRNVKIFANLQKLCETYKRIYVHYGGLHQYDLNLFINTMPNMTLVDNREFLL